MNENPKDQPLVLYDQMRAAILKCAEVDEVAGIKNQATQLEAYARVRDDAESQRRFAEIRLRACLRIGEISRELEKAKPGPITSDRSEVITKEQTLNNAGIAVSTAHDYEQLAGGKEKQAQEIASAAAETYFASSQENNEPVSMGGLKGAVRQALTKAFGEPARKERPAKHEDDLLVHFLYSADYFARKANFDPVTLAGEVMEEFAQEELNACRGYLPLLEKFIQQLKERFNHVK
jgi:hypothetical protein